MQRIAALLSFAAGLIHLAVFPEHLEEWWGYGLFFLVLGLTQTGYGLLVLFDRSRQVLLLGIFGNVLIGFLYLITRTVGIPLFGPEAGRVEGVGAIDLASKLVELALVLILATMLAAGERSQLREMLRWRP